MYPSFSRNNIAADHANDADESSDIQMEGLSLDLSVLDDYYEELNASDISVENLFNDLCDIGLLNALDDIPIVKEGPIVENNTETKHSDELPTSRGVKRGHDDIEDVQDVKKGSNIEECDIAANFYMLEQLPSTSQQHYTCNNLKCTDISVNESSDGLQSCLKCVAPKKLKMKTNYNFVDILHKKLTVSIYEIVIEKIEIDERNLLKDNIIKEFGDKIKRKGFKTVDMDISRTYSKMRKYVLDKVSPYLNKIIQAADIVITPGMSILNIKQQITSNKIFFDKLRECCMEITKNINQTCKKKFLSHIQSHIYFGSGNIIDTNIVKISNKRKDNFSRLSKFLIMDAVLNLPLRMKSEIDKLSLVDVSRGLFASLHGVSITKSFMRDVVKIYTDGISMRENRCLKIDYPYIKTKLEESAKLHVVLFDDKTFSLNKSAIKIMIKYLLIDMTSIYFKKKFEFPTENNVSDFYTSEQLPSTINIDNHLQLNERLVMPKGLMPVSKFYKWADIRSTKITSSIYELAIEDITIDEKNLLKNSILEEFDNLINVKGFDKSAIDISLTYLNISKYILLNISPYIANIMRVADLVITPGMSITSIKHKCISNDAFFDKLHEYCKEIAKNINQNWNEKRLSMIQTYVYFGSGKHINTNIYNIARAKRDRISMLLKYLVIDDINHLSRNIRSKIINFKQSDILKGIFTTMHGIYVTKSFMRDVVEIYTNDILAAENKYLKVDYSFIREKLEELVRPSVVLIEGTTLSPNKYTIESIVDYLLSDMAVASVDTSYNFPINNSSD